MGNSSTYREPLHASRTAALLFAVMIASIAIVQGNAASLVMQTLHEFHYGPSHPQGSLLEVSDGSFYGVTADGGAHGLGTVYRMTRQGVLTTLISFDFDTGGNPYLQGLIKGSDGNFYGVTTQGGVGTRGTVFKLDLSRTLTVLASFNGTNGDTPTSLIQGMDGNFYGTTLNGGMLGGGTVFKVTPGGPLTTMASFTGVSHTLPRGLAQNSDGSFYGITQGGGIGRAGTLFKITPDGILTTVVSFNGPNGGSPYTFMRGSDGSFYGTTTGGGTGGYGTVFKVTPSGIFNTLVSFDGANGRWASGLIQGKDGNLYGTTDEGGTDGFGTIFRITPDGALTTLVSLKSSSGRPPWLTQGSDGSLYGTTVDGSWAEGSEGSVSKVTPEGEFKVLARFGSPGGYGPSGLVAGNDGAFYGTTLRGGTLDAGTTFKMTPDGIFTTLASFDYLNNGMNGMIQGSDGNFYGPAGTFEGITGFSPSAQTVFKMTPDGALTKLASFSEDGGRKVLKGLIQGSDSNLYGITGLGGPDHKGSIFRITRDGAFTTLVSFNGTNGAYPYLFVQGSDGNLYGAASPDFGVHGRRGMIFKITPNGAISSLVESNSVIGGGPTSLIQGHNGNLYGTTFKGDIFRMSRDGKLTASGVVNGVNGSFPNGLIEGRDGNFYGSTATDYPNEIVGTIFKLTPDGTLTTLVSFTGELGSQFFPNEPRLVEGKNGRIHGILTMRSGGEGVAIFRLVEPPVLSTTRQPDGNVMLSWNSFPGDTYRVEYKPTLTETNWTVLNPAVTATGNTASVAHDSGSASERYYRVRLLP